MPVRSQKVLVAEDMLRLGRADLAVTACYEALRSAPEDHMAHCLLAEVFLSEAFYDEAISSAMKVIEMDPSCAPSYLTLGLAYDRKGGMWDQSILVWHELAEVVPDLVTAHVQLGEALAAVSFEEEAVQSWQRALELDATEARAMYNLAIAALKRDGMATALPGFRKAGELDPSQDQLFFTLAGGASDEDAVEGHSDTSGGGLLAALRAARADDILGAADVVRRALDAHPHDPAALALASYCFLKQGSANEALACALHALSLDPNSLTALYCLGTGLAGRPGFARQAARAHRALAAAVPGEPIPHVLLAESFLAMHHYAAAERSYRQAVDLDPACVRARFGLAAVLLTRGRHADAGWQVRRAAYYDTRRRRSFWHLYDEYAREGE